MPPDPLPWHGHINLTRPLALAPPISHEVSATGDDSDFDGDIDCSDENCDDDDDENEHVDHDD